MDKSETFRLQLTKAYAPTIHILRIQRLNATKSLLGLKIITKMLRTFGCFTFEYPGTILGLSFGFSLSQYQTAITSRMIIKAAPVANPNIKTNISLIIFLLVRSFCKNLRMAVSPVGNRAATLDQRRLPIAHAICHFFSFYFEVFRHRGHFIQRTDLQWAVQIHRTLKKFKQN